MTIATTTSRVDYAGNGVTTAFPVPFVFYGASELRVLERVIATGVETVLTLSTQYTVSGGNGAIGTVTAVTPPPATVQWTILRNTARTQQVDYTSGDPFPADTHERALDRLTALIQENERDQARAVRVAETDVFAPILPTSQARAGRYLAFDSNGVPIAAPGSTSVIPTNAWSEGFLQRSNAGDARTYLGATTAGAALFTGADAAAQRTSLGLGSAALLAATTTGTALVTAADAAAARTAVGATTTGSAVITAADAAAARAAIDARAVYSAEAATTSGSAVAFTGIPADVQEVRVMLAGVRTAASSQMRVELGHGGGPTFVTTGYSTGITSVANAAATIGGNLATGFAFVNTAASVIAVLNLTRFGGNRWLGESVSFPEDGSGATTTMIGLVILPAELTALRVTTSSTFNLGLARILWRF